MSKFWWFGVLSICLLSMTLSAYAEEKKAPSPQSLKMKACHAEAKEKALTGEARKAFMSDCLKKKKPA